MSRTPSQNVLFRGISPNDDPCEPPGRTMAAAILRHLREDGFSTADEDNWRDCGWSIDIEIEQVKLQLSIAPTQNDQWLTQIVPMNEPGVLAQWFGHKFVDRSEEVLAAAWSVDRALRRAGCTEILWQLDGFPIPATSTPVPTAPSQLGDRRSFSPNREHVADFSYVSEIRFGPPYYYLRLDRWNLDRRVFGERHLWSSDSQYLAVQEWHNLVESQGPVTSLVVIDVERQREATLNTVDGAFLIPDGFDQQIVRFHVDHYVDGGTESFSSAANLACVSAWRPVLP